MDPLEEEPNIYYSPELFDLSIVGDISAPLEWEFSIFAVWADGEGNLYYAMDRGCSCPEPFEGVRGVTDMHRIESGHDFAVDARSWGRSEDVPIEDVQRLIVAVRQRMRS